MNLLAAMELTAGGTGSGCHGPNCGRPSGGGGKKVATNAKGKKFVANAVQVLKKYHIKKITGSNLQCLENDYGSCGSLKKALAKLGVNPDAVVNLQETIEDWTGSPVKWLQKAAQRVVTGKITKQSDKALAIEYALAQKDLPKMVTLYRGVGGKYAQGILNKGLQQGDQGFVLRTNGADSWTDKKSTAESFGGLVIKARIPREFVISSYRTNAMLGDNWGGEHEHIVAFPGKRYRIKGRDLSIEVDDGSMNAARGDMVIDLRDSENWLRKSRKKRIRAGEEMVEREGVGKIPGLRSNMIRPKHPKMPKIPNPSFGKKKSALGHHIPLSARAGGPGAKNAGIKTPKNPLGNVDELKEGMKHGNYKTRRGGIAKVKKKMGITYEKHKKGDFGYERHKEAISQTNAAGSEAKEPPETGAYSARHTPKDKYFRDPAINANQSELGGFALSHMHMQPIDTFNPPSLVKRGKQTRVPTDDPGETDDRFMDVTKRNSKDTWVQRMKLLKRQAPGGSPAQIPARTSLIPMHSGTYLPTTMMSAEKPLPNNQRPVNWNRQARQRTSYARRGCI